MNWLKALVVSRGWVVSNRYGMRLMTGGGYAFTSSCRLGLGDRQLTCGHARILCALARGGGMGWFQQTRGVYQPPDRGRYDTP